MVLADYLKTEHLSAAEFARSLGVSRSIVLRWAKRERTPRGAQIKRITSLTGGRVTAADFFDEPASEAAA